jgi:ankyrin repeat protein
MLSANSKVNVVEMIDARGFTVLSLAAFKGHEQVVRMLYQHGVE